MRCLHAARVLCSLRELNGHRAIARLYRSSATLASRVPAHRALRRPTTHIGRELDKSAPSHVTPCSLGILYSRVVSLAQSCRMRSFPRSIDTQSRCTQGGMTHRRSAPLTRGPATPATRGRTKLGRRIAVRMTCQTRRRTPKAIGCARCCVTRVSHGATCSQHVSYAAKNLPTRCGSASVHGNVTPHKASLAKRLYASTADSLQRNQNHNAAFTVARIASAFGTQQETPL